MRLLLVEDDKLLGQSMVTSLSRHGYTVDWLEKGAGVTSALKTEAFTAVILDLTLPSAPQKTSSTASKTQGEV